MLRTENLDIPDLNALKSDKTTGPINANLDILSFNEEKINALMAIEGVSTITENQDEYGNRTILIGVIHENYLKNLSTNFEGVRIIGKVIGKIDAL